MLTRLQNRATFSYLLIFKCGGIYQYVLKAASFILLYNLYGVTTHISVLFPSTYKKEARLVKYFHKAIHFKKDLIIIIFVSI